MGLDRDTYMMSGSYRERKIFIPARPGTIVEVMVSWAGRTNADTVRERIPFGKGTASAARTRSDCASARTAAGSSPPGEWCLWTAPTGERMKKKGSSRWVPVRVFRVGYLQAVLWQRFDGAGRAPVHRCKVSLHRAGDHLTVDGNGPTFIAHQELHQAIEALIAAQAFLSHELDSRDSAQMFVPAIDLLEAKAPW